MPVTNKSAVSENAASNSGIWKKQQNIREKWSASWACR